MSEQQQHNSKDGSEAGEYSLCVEMLIDHLCCCFVNRSVRDPFEFRDDRKEYRALCGAFHVQQMAVIFVVIKAFLLTVFVVSVCLMDAPALVTIGCIFFYLVTMASCGFLLGGISLKYYSYMIPYFFVSFLSILVAVIHFFVDLLDSANSKDTLETHQLIGFATQTGAIAFEVYSLAVAWRVFQYICDYAMEMEIRVKDKYRHILLETDVTIT
ncbi:hypothetical protein L596_006459 [Steinernema carpocapsae]|uniref:MARVEL domain-containing protein n=1 Tax=Steinernema carpocapsae TaxID=34508 RepID=A0A4U8V2D4_STECR|nr:hypothetical protein L596_006459 [Steinernema carpocapsae]